MNALLEGLGPELFANIRYLAIEDGEQKALNDLRQLDEGLTDTELPGYAEYLWGQRRYATDGSVRNEAMTLRARGIAPRDVYAHVFSTTYRKTFEARGVPLLDDDTGTMYKQARADKIHDAQQPVSLSERERVAQAAIRVYEHLGIAPHQRDALHKKVRLYEAFYQTYSPASEGGNGSVTSLDGFRSEEKTSETSDTVYEEGH